MLHAARSMPAAHRHRLRRRRHLPCRRAPRSASSPSETSMAAWATPASASPSAMRGVGRSQSRAQGWLDRLPLAPLRQRAGGIAERAADPDVVADPRAIAAQCGAVIDEAMHGHADRQAGRAWCRRRPARCRAGPPARGSHRGSRRAMPRRCQATTTTSVHHAGCAPIAARSDRFTASAFQPMSAGAVSIGKCTPALSVSVATTSSFPGRHPQQRGIVADAEHHVGARPGAGLDAGDEIELRQDGSSPCLPHVASDLR